ncbi:hypothetical protein FB567DRAFT_266882 [Paraphoma chrysanthemicola]|uniref:Uncharacterized protein n=1 Tax=Paraphoma chrysanthemicola TaxID=798071 RepID=A0A8K0R9Z5_9PLEO|nr:hypothetical protein FB567DRAFT_266882 [Paraphoma chrysanthemicola]
MVPLALSAFFKLFVCIWAVWDVMFGNHGIWRALGCGWIAIAELAAQMGILQLHLLIATAGGGTEGTQALQMELLDARGG